MAYLRVPSIIFTLGINAVAQGLIVVQTGGFAPQDRATPAMHLLATGRTVLGGTHILGGRGSYLGTVVGVVLITLLQSILSVMQMPEMGRQVIYGVVIIVMLLVYGRGRRISD